MNFRVFRLVVEFLSKQVLAATANFRPFKGFGAPMFCALIAVSHLVSAQAVSLVPNKLGLEIERASLNAESGSVTIVFRNASTKGITAFALDIAAGYSNGKRLGYTPSVDFFVGIGIEQFASPDQPAGVFQPGTSRASSLSYPQAGDPGAAITDVRVGVTGVVFDDGTTVGQSESLSLILSQRDIQSAELLRWCTDVDQILRGPITRKAFDDFIGTHMVAEKLPKSPNKTLAESTRNMFASLLQQGFQWRDDGTGSLLPTIVGVVDAKCNAAKTHLGNRGVR